MTAGHWTPDADDIDIPEGWIVVDAVILAKCLDEEGNEEYLLRLTSGLGEMEGYGMLDSAAITMMDRIQESWVDEDEDEDA